MRSRATVTYVSEHIYCSSTMHYGVSITLVRAGKYAYREYDFDGFLLAKGKRGHTQAIPCPKYIETAILERLREMHSDGTLKVYEITQDGERRYNDLRYHHEPHFEHLIGLQPTEASE